MKSPLTAEEIVERAKLKHFLYRHRLRNFSIALLIVAAILTFILVMRP